ncbi:crossover junction endodeoxyribonuclease RuvC [Candidatus Contubernalis alkaliaceticus]|uniref:crossover junction endodeoxyribonuclease RuvC n=1 Tax=Candidatus Contubernalis alkaliaceticus TaxID=338645 RepID=UPI001F4BF6FD|nr:crossover junction endodeoxyribonuclease RuvC [Candidatus Contubernalis alkalaceticus]
MLSMGIDPGIALTGYGIVKEQKGNLILVTYGCIRTTKDEDTCRRLVKIYQNLRELMEEYSPDSIAVEELFFNKNVRSAFRVGEARGVALLAAAHFGVEAFEYTPLQVKQSVVGYGRAAKSQIQEMVKIMLKIKTPVKPDDAADALALAICHCHSRVLKIKGIL